MPSIARKLGHGVIGSGIGLVLQPALDSGSIASLSDDPKFLTGLGIIGAAIGHVLVAQQVKGGAQR